MTQFRVLLLVTYWRWAIRALPTLVAPKIMISNSTFPQIGATDTKPLCATRESSHNQNSLPQLTSQFRVVITPQSNCSAIRCDAPPQSCLLYTSPSPRDGLLS